MISHFFECTRGHITTKTIHSDKVRKTHICNFNLDKNKRCKAKSERVFLPPSIARNALAFRPTLLYINKNGDVINPGRNDPSHLPSDYLKSLSKKGYKEITINNSRQYSDFQRQMRTTNRDKYDEFIHNEQQAYDSEMKQNIDFLKSGGTIEMPNPDGSSRTVRIPPLDKMHPSMRRLAEYSIEQATGHKISRPFEDVRIESYENDNTYYRDKDTGWKKRN